MIYDLKDQEKDFYSNLIKKLIKEETIDPNDPRFHSLTTLFSEKYKINTEYEKKGHPTAFDVGSNLMQNVYLDKDINEIKMVKEPNEFFIKRLNNLLNLINCDPKNRNAFLKKFLSDLYDETLSNIKLQRDLNRLKFQILSFEKKSSKLIEERAAFDKIEEEYDKKLKEVTSVIDLKNRTGFDISKFSIQALASKDPVILFYGIYNIRPKKVSSSFR